MNIASLARSVPLWFPLLAVVLMAAALWGILTLLGAGTLETLPDNIRPLALTLASIGNVITALTGLAFWPLITMAFWSTGVLLAGPDAPEFRDLLRGIGLAHVPAMTGTVLAWVIVAATGLSIPPEVLRAGTTRPYLESLASVRAIQVIILLSYSATALSFVAVMRALFRTSWIRATAAVTLPLVLYYVVIIRWKDLFSGF